jgi:predicted ATPase
MSQIVENWGLILGNHLIVEQMDYDLEALDALAADCIAKLNQDQHAGFDQITTAITTGSGQTFFLHGPGGTGKTYLYNTLCYHLRSQGKCHVSSWKWPSNALTQHDDEDYL